MGLPLAGWQPGRGALHDRLEPQGTPDIADKREVRSAKYQRFAAQGTLLGFSCAEDHDVNFLLLNQLGRCPGAAADFQPSHLATLAAVLPICQFP
jgi:hypothetical protein